MIKPLAGPNVSQALGKLVEGRDLTMQQAGRNFLIRSFNISHNQVENLMSYARILKFNPYHDKRGRFTSKGGIGMAGVHSVSLGGVFNPQNNRDRVAYHKAALAEAAQTTYTDFSKELSSREEEFRLASKAQLERDLTSKELEALAYYTGFGSKRMNNYLNGKGLPEGEETRQRILTHTGHAQAAFDSARVQENVVVYRAFSVSRLGMDKSAYQASGKTGLEARVAALQAGVKVDTVFSEKGFGSTSINPGNASNFMNGGRVMARIEVKKGARGAFVDWEGLTENFGERELILPPGSKYRVKKVSTESLGFGKVAMLHLELLDNG